MPDIALWDLVAPYFLLGGAFGNVHAALAVLRVEEYETADDQDAAIIRGRARFHGDVRPFVDLRRMTFGVTASNTEGGPRDDPSQRDPWIDLRDTTVDFHLVAPRVQAGAVVASVGANPPPTDVANALTALDGNLNDPPPSDFPSSEFRLDLVLTTAILRPPFLKPAKLRDDGLLEPDPTHRSVSITLPKVKLRLSHDSSNNPQPVLALLSLGASGLDDPGNLAIAQLVTMDPPYAFIGDGRVVGFGFRTAVLDLADGATPPDVLSQFGFDESWTGVYFPEIRLFVAPQGAEGLAVNVGVRNLLLGVGAHSGVTGDFEADVINQGTGALTVGARFYDENGRGIGITRIDANNARVNVPQRSRIVVDVSGRRPPYTTSIKVGTGDFQTERTREIDLGTDNSVTIVARGQADTATTDLTIVANRRPESQSITISIPGNVPRAELTGSTTTRGGTAVSEPAMVIDSQTDSSVTVRLTDRSEATWQIDGAPQGAASRLLTVQLAPNESKQVRATVAGTPTKAPIYFHFDNPPNVTDDALDHFAANTDNTHTTPAVDEPPQAGWLPGGVHVTSSSQHSEALGAVTAGTTLVVVGHASFENDPSKATYNLRLSERRAKVARKLYQSMLGIPAASVTINLEPRGFTDAQPAQAAGTARREFWRAELKNAISIPGPVTTATVARGPIPAENVVIPIPVVDPPVQRPQPPDFFRSIGVKVRIVRDEFVAVELHGEVDFETATEQALANRAPANDLPTFQGLGHQNPGDGIVKYRALFTINPAGDEWALILMLGAHPSDVDGLIMTGAPAGSTVPRSAGRDILGMYTLFLPILAGVAPETPGEASTGDLVLTGALAALPVTLAATGWFTVERVILYGGEVQVLQRNGAWSTALLADVEVAVSANLSIGAVRLLEIDRQRPLVARYKAVGIRFGQAPNGAAIFHPVFDSARGYTLDIAQGGNLRVVEPLGSILKVVGARISKSNPVMFEIELGGAVDLGVVSLDRCGVRVRLDESPPSIELTALGASVDVPGTLEGSGYFRINEGGFAGRIDLTIVPIKLRVAAALRVENITAAQGGPATGVAVAIEVQFPVAIPLANSGLGIYGLLGLFAMHFTRNEAPDAASTTKALSWLKRANGDPTRIEEATLWKPQVDSWAFGVGALIGTMGSEIVFNMKGVVLLELPGPRLLLMMKANLLMPMPKMKGTGEGTMLAIVDLDMVANTLTIGIVVEYKIDPLLHIRIPIEAFFDTDDATNWHVYIGKFADPVRADILGVFHGTGYLMLVGEGTGNPDFPTNLPQPAGFAIATGLYVSMVWGSKPARLYAELAAGFDAVLGFSPLLVAGTIRARGELRLFIVSLSASATLNIRLGELPGAQPADTGYKVDGQVCGSIDFFFFSISACVDFELSDKAPPDIAIPDLVSGLSVVSRSPALVHGTASDQPVDASLADAIASNAEPNWGSLTGEQAKAAAVPIDAIPLIMCAAPPFDDAHPGNTGRSAAQFFGKDLGGSPGGREVVRSDTRLTYELESVELIGAIGAGKTPATWITLRPPNEANESAQLALLSWVPNATPKALQSSDVLDQTVTDRWGTVCHDPAPPAAVLWTFRFEPLGPSARGWVVDGEPWPDPPDTVRSTPPSGELVVTERWRSGVPAADSRRGITPAEVVGALVSCPPKSDFGGVVDLGEITDGVLAPRLPALVPQAAGAEFVESPAEPLSEAAISPAEVLQRLFHGIDIPRSALRGATTAFDQDPGEGETCGSRVLASPRFDLLQPVPDWDEQHGEEVKAIWEASGFDPGDLADGVVLRPGPFEELSVLLFVPRRLLEGGLVVRALTEDGAVVDEVVADPGHIVSWLTLPPTWTDPAGPWDDDVFLVMEHLNTLDGGEKYVAVLVAVGGGGDADRVLVGVRLIQDWDLFLPGPAFFVAAVEALTTSERSRHGYDNHTVKRNRSVLEAALGSDSSDAALLKPNTAYRVKVQWSASARDGEGNTASRSHTQNFWFRTAAQAPERLDPWILATQPYEGERHVFGGEPLQLVFGTNNMQQLFAGYDRRLELRLEAASGEHPDPAVTGIDHPLVLEASKLVGLSASLLSPWEEAVVTEVDGECVPVDETRIRHTSTSVAIPLHAATDYLMDIESVPKSAPAGTRGKRIFRRSFSTSRFGTLEEYARFFQGTSVVNRYAPVGALAGISAAFASRPPEGEELDLAFEAAGLERLGVPEATRVLVFWEGTGTPQPTGLVVDGPEPLWRLRERARKRTVPNTDLSYYELFLDEWAKPVRLPASTAAVTRIIKAPGGQRAVVVLGANSRGKRLQLALERKPFAEVHHDGPAATTETQPIVDVAFQRAPWEEA